MGRVIKYLTLIVAATILSCCYDSFDTNTSPIETSIPTPNITISQLHSLLLTDRLIIYDDMVVQGSVTSTDQSGNFYKSFIIQRDGYALEILEGLYDSYVRHDVGSVVSIKLKGLALSTYCGVVQVGLVATTGSYYMLDYITLRSLIDQYIFNSYEIEEIAPSQVEISELTEEMCGRLIQIDALQHIPDDDALQPYTWSGYQQFVNNYGDVVYCYTSEYANFSLLSIPQTQISLCGILQYDDIYGVSGGEQYIIKMRSVDDCIE